MSLLPTITLLRRPSRLRPTRLDQFNNSSCHGHVASHCHRMLIGNRYPVSQKGTAPTASALAHPVRLPRVVPQLLMLIALGVSHRQPHIR